LSRRRCAADDAEGSAGEAGEAAADVHAGAGGGGGDNALEESPKKGSGDAAGLAHVVSLATGSLEAWERG
jgi:hypothetical protein